MSRFGEGDPDSLSEQEEREWRASVRAAWKSCGDDLRAFLKYLDAMPTKTIIADRFMRPRNGEACAVATFCRFKGMSEAKMREIEAASRLQRLEYDGQEESDGYEGPTVYAGIEAGLPQEVAAELGFDNDMVWDSVRVPVECELVEDYGRTHCKYYGAHGKHYTMEPMTDAERWFKLRNLIARKVGARPKPLPDRLRINDELAKSHLLNAQAS